MRLTRQSSYAIRTLVYCAVNEPQLSRVADIARAHAISELFLFKLIKPLVENGLLKTVRGRHGGIRLGRPATEITLLDVIQLTEESFAMAECFEGGDVSCPLVDNCDLNGALREALGAFFEVLDGYTIADMAEKRRSLRERLGLKMEQIEDAMVAAVTPAASPIN
ncbi:transcriptional regulator, BadM/Rrf2 family [Devosia enhydra]|uniref:Transcriptional regulator, BadM/Rrf2 family n=1 Tax=Devosia enhydra TaxID=665118 RepID=A0A1K2I240_9HYPH|nr:iron-responsive transcriptional regulator RirA [Devosia enhydra]SFZ86458.1 transcriptional regulator, BadM/Rrf2 family [Devosia enhydra]